MAEDPIRTLDPRDPVWTGLLARDPALASVLPRLTRFFALAPPWAPALVLVGAQAGAPDGTSVSATGIGADLRAAAIRALGETAERLCAFERPGDIVGRVPPGALAEPFRPAVRAALAAQGGEADTPIGAVAGADEAGRPVLLPADLVLRRPRLDLAAFAARPSSSGMAAGRTREDAIRRALLEVIERDAAWLWWRGGRPAGPVPGPDAFVAALRRGADEERRTWCLDLTGDVGVPVVAAIGCDPDGRGFAAGVAARPSRDEACRAALRELAGQEVGLILAQGREEGGDGEHHRHTAFDPLSFDVLSCPLLRPQGPPPPPARFTDPAAALRAADHPVFVCDLTREDLAVPVVKVVAPTLVADAEGPSPRLAAMAALHPEGARWTCGVPLF